MPGRVPSTSRYREDMRIVSAAAIRNRNLKKRPNPSTAIIPCATVVCWPTKGTSASAVRARPATDIP